tara:strand:- start:193 stop:678 length:486 start_codon:yes stop_codon:yes gene_type:complete
MSKVRDINSIEKAVEYAIKSVGVKNCIESIKDLTGQNKSESAIYKWSDPDTDQNIQYRYAIALDIACIKRGIKPPMLSIHREILDTKGISGSNEKYDLINELLKVNSEIGVLNNSVENSTRDDSDEGKNLSPRELSEIKDVLTSVENKLNKLKTSLFQESE